MITFLRAITALNLTAACKVLSSRFESGTRPKRPGAYALTIYPGLGYMAKLKKGVKRLISSTVSAETSTSPKHSVSKTGQSA